MEQAFLGEKEAEQDRKKIPFELLVSSLTDRLKTRWVEKRKKNAGQFFSPTWSTLFEILLQGTAFKYHHEFKQIIIQYYSALTVSCTTSQSKRLCCCSRKKSFFLNRAIQTLNLPKCRLFSYYHWLCCHMLTGFRRPQQDPCLDWHEFYISFLLCNLNSRDEATVLEC